MVYFSEFPVADMQLLIHHFFKATLALFVLTAAPLTVSAQTITHISGFHASSESDPFAKKGILEVTSIPSPVAGLNGVQATVTVGCHPIYLISASLGLGFKIGITGANLDIVTSSRAVSNGYGVPSSPVIDRNVETKLRFDNEDTINASPPASDTHHVEIPFFEMEHAGRASRLLIGLSANGYNVYLQLNLGEGGVKDVVQGCIAAKQRLIDEEVQSGPATLYVHNGGPPGGGLKSAIIGCSVKIQ